MQEIEKRYADLLVSYCLDLQAGEKLLVRTTTLAEPLVREVYRLAMRKGAQVVLDLKIREATRIYFEESNEDQLRWISPVHQMAMEEFDAFLVIRAPFNLREDQSIDPEKRKIRSEALTPINQVYSQRTADKSLKRCLCQYPTQAAAQEAGMSLEEYQHFVYQACKLHDQDPTSSWINVRKEQARIVAYLNKVKQMHYQGERIDVKFSVKGRTWINSDGQTNMPSGEVYSSAIEDSVEGVIHFDYPSIYMGHAVEGITLWVEKGEVRKWEAAVGQEFLDQIFTIPGARRFGEVAIGTNYNIKVPTKNILFDEKMGGTIHMAVGQSYLQTGGTNQSPIHWDMIADMWRGGKILADGKKIYQDGYFLI
ncbi:MAG: aminopeptidase [Saprospiraceae bacterium]|nr:aminopeptidase [Saprospiraceae bacterium]